MPKTNHIAIAPNGQTFNRSSASKVYSHCVVGRRSEDHSFLNVHSSSHKAQEAKNWDWRVRTLNGQGTYQEYANHAEDHWGRKNYEEGLKSAREFLAEYPHVEDYHAAQLQRRLERHEATDFTTFGYLGWASPPLHHEGLRPMRLPAIFVLWLHLKALVAPRSVTAPSAPTFITE
jgi:hypothetical protein